jgi:hypothetical protein
MKMIFSINKSNTPKKQNIIKPSIVKTESVVPQSLYFFQKSPMFQQILIPYKCGNCGK